MQKNVGILALLFLLASACSTTDKKLSATGPGFDEKAAAVDGDEKQGLVEKGGDNDEDIEEQLAPEDFEDGFCVDDIYATYLIKQYASQTHTSSKQIASSIHKSRSSKRSKSQRREMRRADLDALHYARTHMSGPTMPYFGALPVVVNEQVDFWIRYFKTSGRRDFMRWLVRGESLKKVVQPVLKEEGIPIELFYLAMVESGFSNNAYSRARATGAWQFMKGTAQLYGLKMNHWVDERRDPIKSTVAAATYLRDLYIDMGDWQLAMAAYNAGPGKVRKAIRKSGTKNFWEIAATRELKNETKNYVPKVMAAILLAADCKAHGFDFKANPMDDIPDQEIILQRPVRLKELANGLGLPLSKLKQWNPEIIQEITPPSKDGYALRLPKQYAMVYPSIVDKLTVLEIKEIHLHVVRRGETLSRIARQYKVGIKQILTINPNIKANRLSIGRSIAIPIPSVVVSG